jgi:hypothetical protein
LYDNVPADFATAWATVKPVLESGVFAPDTWFFGEAFRGPRQNALTYGRAPAGGLVLFDALWSGQFWPECIRSYAEDTFHCEPARILWIGESSPNHAKSFLEQESSLGGVPIEGVVVKNYAKPAPYYTGPNVLAVKFVRAEFKEVNKKSWAETNPSRANRIDEIMAAYRTRARWLKSVQRLQDEGRLLHAPQDIGLLLKTIQADVVDEAFGEFCNDVGESLRGEWLRTVIRGCAEWYKTWLSDPNATIPGEDTP